MVDIMRLTVAFFLLVTTGTCWAAEATITDGDTLLLNGKTYRLDGVDAPETDQMCLDEKGSVWPCGLEARDQLKRFVGNRDVRCDGKKFDTVYRKRLIGMCWVEGETMSLNRWLVHGGWAVNLDPYAKKRFKADEDDARTSARGLWKGCFAPPQSARRGSTTTTPVLGAGCGKDEAKARALLFPVDPTMPTGCSIKGKLALRAQLTEHRGIYHLEDCPSYGRAKRPDRWFCSEQEAQAEGFRKAFTC
jgi:endonuclease YncB( thermonuclease family)